jgi:hypothetical protein
MEISYKLNNQNSTLVRSGLGQDLALQVRGFLQRRHQHGPVHSLVEFPDVQVQVHFFLVVIGKFDCFKLQK